MINDHRSEISKAIGIKRPEKNSGLPVEAMNFF